MKKNYKKAFSLAELIVFLVIGAIAIAAFTPAITKKIKSTALVLANNAKASDISDVVQAEPQREFNCSLMYGEGCSECDASTCTTCKDGYFIENNVCIKCSNRTSDCVTCDGNGVCTGCQMGSQLVGGKCEKCPAGYFSSNFSNTTCTPCGAGYYNDNPGLSYCSPCEQGRYSDYGATSCLFCKDRWAACEACTTEMCTVCEANCNLQSDGTCNCPTAKLGSGSYWFNYVNASSGAQNYITKEDVSSINIVKYIKFAEGEYDYKWNASNSDSIPAYVYAFKESDGKYKLIISGNNEYTNLKLPNNASNFFKEFVNLKSISFYDGFDTSSVTNMAYMFYKVGYNVSGADVSIIGLENWNVQSVTSFNYMFYQTAYSASTFTFFDPNVWGSNLKSGATTKYMFYQTGKNASYGPYTLTNWSYSHAVQSYINTGVEDKIVLPFT